MRLLNIDSGASLDSAILYLKKNEVVELIGALEDLLNSSGDAYHRHVNDADYTHEITVAIYDENNLSGFDNRSKRLILEDD